MVIGTGRPPAPELAPQIADVDVDDVRRRVVVVAPHRAQDLLRGQSTWPAWCHEVGEQVELGRRSAAPDGRSLRTARVSRSISTPARRRVRRRRLTRRAQLCADPGLELGERERLDEIVDRAGVEPADAVLDLARGRSARSPATRAAASASSPQHLHPARAREHQVEHDEVDVLAERELESALAVALPRGHRSPARSAHAR